MKEDAYHNNICLLIKLIRNYRGLKQDYVSYKSGFSDRSIYSKLESGKLKNLSLYKYNEICTTIACDANKLMLIASVKEFRYQINSWSEFIDSVNKCDEEEKQKILTLIKELFPNNN
ncbi:MAG: hypothetical protein KBE91_01810 [Bacteroidia bacterium]|nr:hypothetical protein [Bacteroidia bacterium]